MKAVTEIPAQELSVSVRELTQVVSAANAATLTVTASLGSGRAHIRLDWPAGSASAVLSREGAGELARTLTCALDTPGEPS